MVVRSSKQAMKGKKSRRKGKKTVNNTKPKAEDVSDESDIEVVPDVSEQVKYTAPGFPGRGDDNYASDVELDTRKLVAKQNRKKKKSGGFQSMGLGYSVIRGVLKKGYKVPTPIQRKCIPVVMDGKDVVAMARTGSGKTAAFLIPMFEKLQTHSAKSGARALVLSPTRELALQTLKFTKELAKYTSLKSAVILGGDKMENQFAAMHGNPDIIVATPGRFLHVIMEMELKLNAIEYVVFDEADRLFEMGFSEQLQEIIQRLPDDRQTLLFSATLPKLLVEFARAGLNDPVLIRLDVDTKLSDQLKLAFFSVRADDKSAVLLHLLRNVIKPSEQSVIFLSTKHHVEYIREILTKAGINCCYIYSSLDQAARKINVAKFTHRKAMVMLVTDVAARGIDIPMLDNVINYNFPAKPKLFVHRVGRVARAGRSGTAYSLVSSDEVSYFIDLHLFLGRPIKLANVNSGTDCDGVFGRVPQTVIDDEDATIQSILDSSSELEDLKRVCDNAYRQYVKSRPAPAAESVKRMKEIEKTQMTLHPWFSDYVNDMETGRMSMVDGLKNYKPQATILEINPNAKSQRFEVMKAKRNFHSDAIRKFQLKQKEKMNTRNEMEIGIDTSRTELSTEQEIEAAFATMVAPGLKRKKKMDENKSKQKKMKTSVRDEEYYVNYRAPDHHAERGLSIGDSSFDQQASRAMFDLTGDDSRAMNQQKGMLKWDRKKKKFIREGQDQKKKKIKTESGNYIQASFKTNIYQDWLERTKMGDQDNDDDSDDEHTAKQHSRGPRKGFKGGKKTKSPGFPGKQKGKRKQDVGKGKGGKVRSEMKSNDQILKARKVEKRKQQQQISRYRKMRMKRNKGKGQFNKKR